MNHPQYTQAVAGFGDAFPGSAGPFVTPGTSPYQRSGSAASLSAFGATPPVTPVSAAPPVAPPAIVAPAEKNEHGALYMAFSVLGWGSSAAGVYHGYKRNNGSIGWALAWGLLGGIWPVSIPLMLAQGFGKPADTSMKKNRRSKKRGRRGR